MNTSFIRVLSSIFFVQVFTVVSPQVLAQNTHEGQEPQKRGLFGLGIRQRKPIDPFCDPQLLQRSLALLQQSHRGSSGTFSAPQLEALQKASATKISNAQYVNIGSTPNIQLSFEGSNQQQGQMQLSLIDGKRVQVLKKASSANTWEDTNCPRRVVSRLEASLNDTQDSTQNNIAQEDRSSGPMTLEDKLREQDKFKAPAHRFSLFKRNNWLSRFNLNVARRSSVAADASGGKVWGLETNKALKGNSRWYNPNLYLGAGRASYGERSDGPTEGMVYMGLSAGF